MVNSVLQWFKLICKSNVLSALLKCFDEVELLWYKVIIQS